MVAVVAVQVREQEHQWKRERSDNRSNPRPDFEAASSTLGNSAGKIHRTDRSDRQQCEENVAVEGNDVGAHLCNPLMLPCAAYSMELVARRLAVKTLSIQAETLPRRVQGRLTIIGAAGS
jgi:hypothetical protein